MNKCFFYPAFIGLLCSTTGCKDNNAQAERKSMWVKCDTVRRTFTDKHLQFPARVKAAKEVNLAFKVGGTLERLFATEGKRVKQGDLIAQLDARDYAVQLQAVEGEYLGIKADAERAFALYADSVIPMAEYDKARYGLKQITAKREHAKNQLADTKLYAPFDGVVKQCLFDAPAIIGAGMPVMVMHSAALPELEIHIPSTVYRRWEEIGGFSAKFDFLTEAIPLRLIAISSSVNTNQLHSVRLALPDTMSAHPSVGMSAMVEIEFTKAKDSLMTIPINAVFHEGNSDYVWTLSDGQAVRRTVSIKHLHTDGRACVWSGLKEGEIIISAGAHNLKEGQSVKPLSAIGQPDMKGQL